MSDLLKLVLVLVAGIFFGLDFVFSGLPANGEFIFAVVLLGWSAQILLNIFEGDGSYAGDN